MYLRFKEYKIPNICQRYKPRSDRVDPEQRERDQPLCLRARGIDLVDWWWLQKFHHRIFSGTPSASAYDHPHSRARSPKGAYSPPWLRLMPLT